MSTDANPGLPIGGLASLFAQPDSLRAEQDPEYLSRALRSAFTEREPYEIYLSSILHDEARVKVLLEVFDKVCTGNKCHFVKLFSVSLSGTGTHSPTKRHQDIRDVPRALRPSGSTTCFTHYN